MPTWQAIRTCCMPPSLSFFQNFLICLHASFVVICHKWNLVETQAMICLSSELVVPTPHHPPPYFTPPSPEPHPSSSHLKGYYDIVIYRLTFNKPCQKMASTSFTILISFLLLAVTVNSCSPSDKAALMAFKAALNEPYLGIFKTWTGNDCCKNWYGISCDPSTHRVADINLRGESEDPIFQKAKRSGYMTGTLSPAICKLDRLSSVIIADWKGISGPIPACITSLKFLRIFDVVGNRITGKIPADLGKLQLLTVFNVADNMITGKIPSSIVNLVELMHLDLRNNRITGEIPRLCGKMKMLSRILLSRNQLYGPIPASISKIYRLADLDVSSNLISGAIPESLGKMAVLSTLNLDNNKLTGHIPASLLSGSGLSILNLSRNSLEGNIPDVFGARSYFTEIDLSFNKLSGPIPKSISGASYIGHLDLRNNHLCGHIPAGSPFDHLEASSFVNNDCLCGSPLRKC